MEFKDHLAILEYLEKSTAHASRFAIELHQCFSTGRSSTCDLGEYSKKEALRLLERFLELGEDFRPDIKFEKYPVLQWHEWERLDTMYISNKIVIYDNSYTEEFKTLIRLYGDHSKAVVSMMQSLGY